VPTIDVVQSDRHGSRSSAVVDVKAADHARDLDRLGRVNVPNGLRQHALVRSALIAGAGRNDRQEAEPFQMDDIELRSG
jgi:DNA-binding transcriptional regulator/RsmH inhibitor MraZ